MPGKRLSIPIHAALLALVLCGCGAPNGTNGAVGAAIEPAFTGVSGAAGEWPEDEASDAIDSAVVEGGVEAIDDPFRFIGPAFSGIGLETHSTACDPFDDAYGSCL